MMIRDCELDKMNAVIYILERESIYSRFECSLVLQYQSLLCDICHQKMDKMRASIKEGKLFANNIIIKSFSISVRNE
jgi:hypothetical protein